MWTSRGEEEAVPPWRNGSRLLRALGGSAARDGNSRDGVGEERNC